MDSLERVAVQAGDTVLFVTRERKTYLRTLIPGARLQTHLGFLEFDALLGLPYGSRVQTHLGQEVWMLKPNLDDVIRHLRRETQIMYPKDIGYVLLKLNVQPGVRVIEAGTGSGGLTSVLASLVGAEGHVYSYERRPQAQALARQNIERLGLAERVTFIERDIAGGFDQTGVHALFLDMHDPWVYLAQAHAALRGGGFLGSIVPTLNQVLLLNEALYRPGWFLVEVEEILLRQYKTSAQRVRPEDQMIGHTGFLMFARAVMASGGVAEDLPQPAEGDLALATDS